MKNPFEIKSDIQSETSPTLAALNWVGMSQIQSSVRIHEWRIPCALDVGVNLKQGFRGIHMSRLYQQHQESFLHQQLNFLNMNHFLTQALYSQADLSDEIAMKISLQFPMQTKSLKSQLQGFRNYPVQLIFEKSRMTEDVSSSSSNKIWIQIEVLYSSTCPQSAGLSVEALNSDHAALSFTPKVTVTERLPATPHAQRSRAIVCLQVMDFSENFIQEIIQYIEHTLKTPVQTAVKKVDEMEFARLNAQNLMFCEDAARLLAGTLIEKKNILGFSVFCEHQESLHPHNASSYVAHQFLTPQKLAFTF